MQNWDHRIFFCRHYRIYELFELCICLTVKIPSPTTFEITTYFGHESYFRYTYRAINLKSVDFVAGFLCSMQISAGVWGKKTVFFQILNFKYFLLIK